MNNGQSHNEDYGLSPKVDKLILNRYRPISEAGAGGFSTVQVAWDTRIQRRVAIKCIQLNEEDVASGILPGLDEARTAAMLTDSSIVGVYDFEVQGSTAYLIMEFVDGVSLLDLVEDYPDGLDLDIVAAVFSCVVRALNVAHSNQVLHLDIKPDNVLINRQGEVKVADFGLAALSDAMGFKSATGGTIGYMPPEQMNQENLDARCDEWALASLTYEMIMGNNPFLADTLKDAKRAIFETEVVIPSVFRDDLDPAADDVIFYALDPDRQERYATIEDFAEELMPFLGDEKAGQKKLSIIIGQAQEDFLDSDDEDEFDDSPAYFQGLSSNVNQIVMRVWSAINVFILGLVALNTIPAAFELPEIVFWISLIVLVVAGVVVPTLASALVILALVVALFIHQAYLVGVLLLVAGVMWWIFFGRKGSAQTNSALMPAFAGSFGLNQISPLMIGFFLDTKAVLANTAFALFLSLIFAGLGSNSLLGWNAIAFWDFADLDIQQNMFALLTEPSTWVIMLSWFLAAILLRLLRFRNSRVFSYLGIGLATFTLLAGLFLATWLDSGFTAWFPGLFPLFTTLVAGVIAAGLCMLGIFDHEDTEEWYETELDS